MSDRPEAPRVLDEGQLTALRNLAMKKAGKDVDWITIADARNGKMSAAQLQAA